MDNGSQEIAARVRDLAAFLVENDLESLRIDRGEEVFEVGRVAQVPAAPVIAVVEAKQPIRVDQIASDRVGIFRFSRPVPFPGELLDGDRELGFVEQLGIRNPIRSRGGGRIVAIFQQDGDVVDYGRPLFEVERV